VRVYDQTDRKGQEVDGINGINGPRHRTRKQKKVVSKSSVRLSPGAAPSITNLKILQLCFELLDGTVSHFQVLVQAIPLGDQLLRCKLMCDNPETKPIRTCCSHCLNLASSDLTCSVNFFLSSSSSSLNFGLSSFFTFGSPNLRVSI
jgi:hypothetical protein